MPRAVIVSPAIPQLTVKAQVDDVQIIEQPSSSFTLTAQRHVPEGNFGPAQKEKATIAGGFS
jgi:hypothetical protein